MVTDNAGIFSDYEAQNLREKLMQYELDTSHEIVVLTIKELGNNTIEQYAYGVYNQEKNKFGKDNVDNGLLLLIAPNQRQVRIEVGNGFEPIITDVFSSHIIDYILTPYFKKEQYFKGVSHAIYEIIQLIQDPIYAQEFGDIYRKKAEESEISPVTKVFASLFLTLVFTILLYYCYCKFVLKASMWKTKIKPLYNKYKLNFWLLVIALFCVVYNFYTLSWILFMILFVSSFLSIFVFVGFGIILKLAFKRAITIFKSLLTGKLGFINFWWYFPLTFLLFFAAFAFGFTPIMMGFFMLITIVFNKDINEMISNFSWEFYVIAIALIFISLFVIAIVRAIKKIKSSYKETFGFSIFKMGVGLSPKGSSGSGSSRSYSSSGSRSYSSSSRSSSYSGGGGRSSGGGASGSW